MPKRKGQKNKKKYENGATKDMTIPEKYSVGFLQRLDQRTQSFQLLDTAYQQVLADRGGKDTLSHVQVCLIERFVFLEFFLRTLEVKIANAINENKKIPSKTFSRWIYSCNSLKGLATTIGLKRKARQISGLVEYLDEQKPQGRPKKKDRF